MNRDFIKMLAILAMTLNHIGNILMEPGSMLQVIFVDIGYFTAITMCYFLVEGYRYTRDKARCGLRLFAFAVLSEIPYQLAFQGMLEGIGVNMMVTLFLCYLILIVREQRWSATGKVILIFLLISDSGKGLGRDRTAVYSAFCLGIWGQEKDGRSLWGGNCSFLFE